MVGLAQLAEHQIVVLRVVGSSPTTHPIKNQIFIDIIHQLFIIDPSIDIFSTISSFISSRNIIYVGAWRNW